MKNYKMADRRRGNTHRPLNYENLHQVFRAEFISFYFSHIKVLQNGMGEKGKRGIVRELCSTLTEVLRSNLL